MKNERKPLKNSTVLFATFSLWANGHRMPTNGSVEPFRDFIVPRAQKLVLIDQLVPGGESVDYRTEIYLHAHKHFSSRPLPWWFLLLKPILMASNNNGTQIVFKIRDFLSVLDAALREKQVIDYIIGLESINALAGILLRHMGKVRTVVYYVSDYSPNRYPNKLFNGVYVALDRFCAMHADYIWDVSGAMQKARIKAGLDAAKSAPVIHVANGLFPDQIIRSTTKKKEGHALAYMGTIGPENGPDVAIEALSIVRKKYPDSVLHMIGGKPADFVWLAPIVKKLGLSKAVIHHGFVPKAADMAKIMSTCVVGLAPYRSIPGSPRYYGDAGKIRAYAGAGLPIVSSQVPPLGIEAAQYGAAVVTDDDPKHFADAILTLFSDTRRFRAMRSKAQEFAKYNTWTNQFTNAFSEMNTLMQRQG